MRPMWMQFADESDFYPVETQFMLGDSMLVVPKIKTPSDFLETLQMQEVTFTLPKSASWYNYYSKQVEPVTGTAITRNLPDLEQAVFIKGGSILPVLLHDNCMALSKCYWDAIKLEVYLDSTGNAEGALYTDDGVSFEYRDKSSYAKVAFTFNGGLRSKRDSNPASYTFPQKQTVD